MLNLLLLIILVIVALWTALTPLLLRSAIGLALTSVILTIIMFRFDAPYAAAFELSVCAGLIPVIFISVISLTHRLPLKEFLKRRESRISRFWPLPLLLLAAAAALYFIRVPLNLTLPWPEALTDVRAVLWEYRRTYLFGQIMVLLAGVFGVLVLFRERNKDGR
jgi:NADH-quinone oxidoreductase subunit J